MNQENNNIGQKFVCETMGISFHFEEKSLIRCILYASNNEDYLLNYWELKEKESIDFRKLGDAEKENFCKFLVTNKEASSRKYVSLYDFKEST